MNQTAILAAAQLIEQIESLDRAKTVLSGAKDLTVNTAGHTLISIRREQDGFANVAQAIIDALAARQGRLRQQLSELGVDTDDADAGGARGGGAQGMETIRQQIADAKGASVDEGAPTGGGGQPAALAG